MFFQNRRALITGASLGLGAAFAKALAAQGANLILVARSGDKLEALAAVLRREHKVDVQVIVQDLLLPGAVQRVVEQSAHGGHVVDVLVNNAGFGTLGRFEDLSLDRQMQQIMLNLAVLTELTHRLLPAMQQRKFGAILNVASTAGLMPVPYMATYSATKAYVLSFSEALWAENRHRGVNVSALCPGPVDTEFFAAMGKELPKGAGAKQTSEEVVACGLAALQANKCYAVSGARNYFAFQSLRLLPRAQALIMMEKAMAPAAP